MNIFNIIAELCSLIINSCTEEFFVHYSCISNAEKFRINELILEKIPVFFEKETQGLKIFEIHQFSEEELAESLFADINDIVEKFKSRNYYFAIVGLIQILDESLETILQKRIAEFQEDDFSVFLNTNRETTGIGLLPRTSCVWERKHRLSHSYNRMDNFLFNMLRLVVNIFHYEGIGRIAILICKDFLTTKYMEQLMRCFKLTLIIVPSFSTGSYDFRRSFDLCAHDDCNVAWINTCAAIEKGKEQNFENIGYIRKRISRNDDEAQMLCKMPICETAFKGECHRDCIYYETISGV